jgi:hypothetical protein
MFTVEAPWKMDGKPSFADGRSADVREVKWLTEPQEHDYPAAASYLSLVADSSIVELLVAALRTAPIGHHKAKDILRAAELALLPANNPHVAADLAKIDKGRALSPVLLVRGDLLTGRALQIADGYHRVCASFLRDENTDIPCRIVSSPMAG